MPTKRVDLDAILGEDALELTLAGKTFTIKDAPVSMLLRIQQAAENNQNVDALEIIREVLGPLGWAEEHEKQIGTKAAIMASAVIADHFTSFPDALAEVAPGVKRLLTSARETIRSTGPAPSAGS